MDTNTTTDEHPGVTGGGKLARRYADRRRFGRPGPKDDLQTVQGWRARSRPRRVPRPVFWPLDLAYVRVPPRLPGDGPYRPEKTDNQPFGFRSASYDQYGQVIPVEPAEQWVRRIVAAQRDHRIAETILYDRGRRIRVSTVFVGVETGEIGENGPALWETLLSACPDRDGPRVAYCSRDAARYGHALIVAALRAGFADRRPQQRRRPPPLPGVWRAGYQAKARRR